MDVIFGTTPSEEGPGVTITLTEAEVVSALEAWLGAQGVLISGSRTVCVNGVPHQGNVVIQVAPQGSVFTREQRFSGRGPEGDDEFWRRRRRYDLDPEGDAYDHDNT